MQIVFYAVLFVLAVTIAASFVQTLLYPPVAIDMNQLPDAGRNEVARTFPEFVSREIKHMRPRHRYLLNGTLNNAACEIKLDMTPDGELAEIEFRDMSWPKTIVNKRPIAVSSIPTKIADLMETLVVVGATDVTTAKAKTGMIDSKNVYDIEFRAGEYEYEFLVSEFGHLIEFEKEHRDF